MQGDSTVNQLIAIYDNLARNFDLGITTQSVYFDISKAFDRVWHEGLLLKLASNGICGKLLQWFQNYLSDRVQCVVIKGETSDYQRVPAGVPQGSALGPLLFLVYINDIVDNIDSMMKLFADDTSMSLSSNDTIVRTNTLNSDLEKVAVWATKWKVNFNESKTELVNIKRGNNPVLDLYFSNHTLHEKESHKHLGITLQSNCRWGEHVESIIRKAAMLINCLTSFKYKLSRKALEIMYKSFILPIFDYADVIWDNCTEYQATTLENLHIDALRTIIGAVRGTSHAKILSESGFSSLRERRKRHKILQFF